MAQAKQADKDGWTHNATGCLMKGTNANIFTLTDEDGKLWVLRSKTVPLGSQMGHTVIVNRAIPKDSKSGDYSSETAPQNQLLVTSLKMARDNCKQP